MFRRRAVACSPDRGRLSHIERGYVQPSDVELARINLALDELMKVAPGRFIKSGRSWIPRWRFQPFKDLAAALELLEHAAKRFCLISNRGIFTAQVHIGDRCGTASLGPKARTITTAICRALGMEI